METLQNNQENSQNQKETLEKPVENLGKPSETQDVTPQVAAELNKDLIEAKKTLIEVMQQESDLLDKILNQQTVLHNCVRDKDWNSLNKNIDCLQEFSDQFVELEEKREELCKLVDVRTDSDFSAFISLVRGKLQKSKIENRALNDYISTTRKFLQGVFDSVVPQRRNVTYSKKGEIVRPEVSSIILNKLL